MSSEPPSSPFVSRAGIKLAAALDGFNINPAGRICADLGSHVGGFVDCLLQRGAARVHSIDTSYGTLAWKLRRDPRVLVHERTNALHFDPQEPVSLVTIDTGWTRQSLVLEAVRRMLDVTRADSAVVTLIKPHYEAGPDRLERGVLRDEWFDVVLQDVLRSMSALGWRVQATLESPIRGHGGNREVLAHLTL